MPEHLDRVNDAITDALTTGLRTGPQLEILRPVIEPISRPVMHGFSREEWSSKHLRHYQSVLRRGRVSVGEVTQLARHGYDAVSMTDVTRSRHLSDWDVSQHVTVRALTCLVRDAQPASLRRSAAAGHEANGVLPPTQGSFGFDMTETKQSEIVAVAESPFGGPLFA